jgi:alanine dehydrogenase
MSTSLEQMGPLLGVRNIKDFASDEGIPEGPVLITCVGLPMLDLYVAGHVYDTWLKVDSDLLPIKAKRGSV